MNCTCLTDWRVGCALFVTFGLGFAIGGALIATARKGQR